VAVTEHPLPGQGGLTGPDGGVGAILMAFPMAATAASRALAAAPSTRARTRSWSRIFRRATARSSSPNLRPRCPSRHLSRCSVRVSSVLPRFRGGEGHRGEILHVRWRARARDPAEACEKG
jgi:hypothetical protein